MYKNKKIKKITHFVALLARQRRKKNKKKIHKNYMKAYAST